MNKLIAKAEAYARLHPDDDETLFDITIENEMERLRRKSKEQVASRYRLAKIMGWDTEETEGQK